MQNWRDYQATLKKKATRKKRAQRLFTFLFLPALLILTVSAVLDYLTRNFGDGTSTKTTADAHEKNTPRIYSSGRLLDKKDVQTLLQGYPLLNSKMSRIDIRDGQQTLYADTSLDVSMHEYMLERLDRNNSRYIGIVAMDPTTGRILTMVGYDRINARNNPCTDSRFPAASIFKIVTAAAGIEKCGFRADTTFTYNGGKYTLHKSQIQSKTNRNSQRISLRDSFAQSVNPVFGKIGMLYLKKSGLAEYADAFCFNRTLAFEFPISPSSIDLTEEPYQWAEVASGFNRETGLSPIHGVLIGSGVLNAGRMPAPTVVDRILDGDGNLIYSSRYRHIDNICSPVTAEILKAMMLETIRSGTCRTAFRGYQKDPVLSKLNIGGKTGSISSNEGNVHFDWFVGFAEEKQGPAKLALSIVVGHEKFIGTRSNRYARMLIKKFFEDHFATKNTKPGETGKG